MSRPKKPRPAQTRKRPAATAAQARTAAPEPNPAPRWTDAAINSALVLIVAAIYGRTAGHPFINFDDNVYIYENPHVLHGFSWAGVRWAFTAFHAANWHPLTWLSHMLDCQLFGTTQAAAGAHHLVSAAFHAANSALLFTALRRMTARRWPSAIVAALFAVHPLRVESVAWACERKDVLSGFFFMLTLLAYASYARRPRRSAYLLALGATVLGLLSKPMLVTIPVILLLLDHWPLARRSREWPWRRLLLEKVPFLAAAAAASVLTVIAQKNAGAISNLQALSPGWRLVTAALAGVTYLWKTLWPSRLAVHYMHPAFLGADLRPYALAAAVALLGLLIVTVIAVRTRSREPYVLTGWLWYLVMLAPVSGLVQVGNQFWADRYAYLPLIGMYVMAVWALADLAARSPRTQLAAGAVAGVAIAGYAAAAYAEVGHWQDGRVLFERALEVNRGDWAMQNNLGVMLSKAGGWKEGRALFEHALEARPNDWVIENNFGVLLSNEDPASMDARRHLERAVALQPADAGAHHNLAAVLYEQGDDAAARAEWETALRLKTDYADPHIGLGSLEMRAGQFDEARRQYESALQLEPNNADAHAHLGLVLAGTNHLDEARREFERALALNPGSYVAENGLARWLATAPDSSQRDPERALKLAQHAAASTQYKRPDILATIAAAYAAVGDFAQAEAWQRRAIGVASARSRPLYEQRLQLYLEHRALVSAPR